MLGRAIVLSSIVAAALLAIILQTTNPSMIGPVGLLAVFFLLYVVILGVVIWLLWVTSKSFAFIGRRLMTRRPPQSLSLSRAYYFSSVIALAPVMMLAMQSIGSLGLYEVILITIFLGVGILYITKRSL